MDISNPFDLTKNINMKSGRYEFQDSDKPPLYVMNIVFSNTPDSVYYANEVNKMVIDDPQMVYDFYYFSLSKRNRFGKYNKKSNLDYDEEFLKLIMELFDYSRVKAIDVYDILIENRSEIEKMVYKGGKDKLK